MIELGCDGCGCVVWFICRANFLQLTFCISPYCKYVNANKYQKHASLKWSEVENMLTVYNYLCSDPVGHLPALNVTLNKIYCLANLLWIPSLIPIIILSVIEKKYKELY